MLIRSFSVLLFALCLQSCTSSNPTGSAPDTTSSVTQLTQDLEKAEAKSNDLAVLVAQQEAEKIRTEKELKQAQDALYQIEQAVEQSQQVNEELASNYLVAQQNVETTQYELSRQSQQYTQAMAQLTASNELMEQLETRLEERNADVEALERQNVALQTASTASFVSALDDFLSTLPSGSMVYNTPSSMVKGDKQTISLELSPSSGVENIRRQFAEREGVSLPAVSIDTILLSDQMYATLDASSGLGVRSLNSSKVMTISALTPNVWRWEIEAIEEGEQTLYLQVGVIASINGVEQKPVLIDEPKRVVVAVSTQRSLSDFISNNWQYLIQVLLLPFVIFLWEQFKKRKKAT
ncbi:hypothetical protein [Alteromonas sp. KUL49]|uniref:hypothetical protein n=1 Tax=Alteromonas sp. KUL49 TaxID=2480798 RepID=UPI00102F02BB|nr:hypothetical protein [Alteromonas sp. KUL49]TAP34126.1 hypothetical protein EYS00_19610 [Alteromonas sp. KUL49]GEA13607.1 hypothetical protein KUL49_39820 [Alteromonas sp. KUL49]